MLKRIVKMEFRKEEINTFQNLFSGVKDKIRNFAGCTHVELLQCATDEAIFFTYSYWTDAAALETYRNSTLFRETWSQTKKLFSNKPEAWSVGSVAVGSNNFQSQ